MWIGEKYCKVSKSLPIENNTNRVAYFCIPFISLTQLTHMFARIKLFFSPFSIVSLVILISFSPCHSQKKALEVNITRQYDTIIRVDSNVLYNKSFSWIIKDGYWGILNSENKEIVPCRYDVPVIMGEYYSRSQGDYCLFQTFNPVIFLRDTFAFAELVDLEKGVISPPNIQFLREVGEYFVFSKERKKFGILNNKGQIVIPEISETCIYQVFDSLYLLSYDSSFALHDKSNRVIIPPEKFTDQDYRRVINYFIKHGAFNDWERFDFDTVNIAEEDFIPTMLYFFKKYLNNDGSFDSMNTPKEMIKMFLDSHIDDCHFEGCFRYLDAYLDDSIDSYQVDLDCGTNWYTNNDNPYHSVKGLGNGIIEYCYKALSASYSHVYLELSYYTYCKVKNDKVDTLGFVDFFSEPDKVIHKIQKFMDSLMQTEEGEILVKIDSSERAITMNSNFSLDREAISFWLYFNNDEKSGSGEDQYEIRIPYVFLEEFIKEDGLIRQIQEYERQ